MRVRYAQRRDLAPHGVTCEWTCPDCGTLVAHSQWEQVWSTELTIGTDATVRKPDKERDGLYCYGMPERMRKVRAAPSWARLSATRGRPEPEPYPSGRINVPYQGPRDYATPSDYSEIYAEAFDTYCEAAAGGCGARLRIVLTQEVLSSGA